MKAVIQRVKKASVSVDGILINQIGKGLLIYLGIGRDSTENDIDLLVRKVSEMRIYPDGDKEGVFCVKDIGGEILLVSQFTLYADIKKGRRPSFTDAMEPEKAKLIYEKTLKKFNDSGIVTKGGIFGAMMDIESVNWGPYTIILEILNSRVV